MFRDQPVKSQRGLKTDVRIRTKGLGHDERMGLSLAEWRRQGLDAASQLNEFARAHPSAELGWQLGLETAPARRSPARKTGLFPTMATSSSNFTDVD
jgi:hypothetical protein